MKKKKKLQTMMKKAPSSEPTYFIPLFPEGPRFKRMKEKYLSLVRGLYGEKFVEEAKIVPLPTKSKRKKNGGKD